MKTGLIVKPKNSKALAEAFIYLLENEKLRKRIGINTRSVKQLFFVVL
jgi:glycosyltransferase involved in cell wall biosynthesis